MEELEIISLLLEAANYGITGIVIPFEGDKHPYSETVAFTDKTFESAEDIYDQIDPWLDKSKLYTIDDGGFLQKKIEHYFHQVLSDKISVDWYDDGGYGSVSIMVPSGEIYINSIVRLTRTETYIRKGDMITGKIKII